MDGWDYDTKSKLFSRVEDGIKHHAAIEDFHIARETAQTVKAEGA